MSRLLHAYFHLEEHHDIRRWARIFAIVCICSFVAAWLTGCATPLASLGTVPPAVPKADESQLSAILGKCMIDHRC